MTTKSDPNLEGTTRRPLDYHDPDWLALRERILERDGRKCRNCLSADLLNIHHWRPMAAEAEGVTNWGYSETGNPLLVPESALVTLCRLCHSVLEDSRRRMVRLRNVESEPEPGPPHTEAVGSRNIFQLWELNGRTVPFKAIKESWLQSSSHFMLIERVVIKKWPYGFAWGCYVRDGVAGEQQKINGAGTYSWRMVDG
jgi:hypothetical protein